MAAGGSRKVVQTFGESPYEDVELGELTAARVNFIGLFLLKIVARAAPGP